MIGSHKRDWSVLVVILALVTVCALLGWSAPAWATTPGTGWEAASYAYPTNLPPGGSGKIEINLLNMGAEPSGGSIVVTDTLPPGLTATAAGGLAYAGDEPLSTEEEKEEGLGGRWSCSGTAVVTCESNPLHLLPLPTDKGSGSPISERLDIRVDVASDLSGVAQNHLMVSGGGASSPTSVSDPITISSSEAGLGFSGWNVWFSNANGTPDTQAGSHPYEATFALGYNTDAKGEPSGGETRNIEVDLPPGLFGDPNAVPECTRKQLEGVECPIQTQIGLDGPALSYSGNKPGGPGGFFQEGGLPVYNMVPPPGVPDEFAFSIAGQNVYFDARVSSGKGYDIVEHVKNIPQLAVTENYLTLWGVPAEASHNAQRNALSDPECENGCSVGVSPKPFLTLPTSCAGPQEIPIHGLNTWQDETAKAELSTVTQDNDGNPEGLSGCDRLSVEPSLSVSTDTSFADTPAGLTVDVKVPQESLILPNGLVPATLKDTIVTLPEGVVINPGQANGLAACGAVEANIHGEGPSSCPSASKVGTVHIRTPLLEGELENELEGNVYVLPSNPPDLQLLLAASGDGIYLKLVGNVHLNEVTGQLTTTFSETPELPFTDLKLSFSGGAQAALATPTLCGTYTTTSDFTPWTAPFAADLFPTSSLPIIAGTGGSACESPLPFSPSMIAGSTTDQAAGYTDFSLLLQRGDDQQRISRLQFRTPEGLLGMISKIPLCPEPEASEGTCSSVSQIGHTVVEAGPGPYPLVVPQPGQPPAPIYLTGGYKGAPYGLSIVVPLVVGPFTLQTQVVRGKIEVDPHTARLTVTTDPLPSIVDGIPTDLRSIDAVIDRPGFMFNPTNCAAQAFTGIATSTEVESAPLESHFQVGSCQSLSFKPDFKVSTAGKTSRADGASLNAEVVYPDVTPGNNQASSQSNIASVKVDLPKQLPSRLTTLQKACPAAVFQADPASCPVASRVGEATAVTPVLPVSLVGPAYFVSHAGEEFPSLIVVLQGYGVTIDLVGTTFINSKTDITSSTFEQIPDVPITSFDLRLPQGPYSALAANANLCKSVLKMPTLFTAQDGAVIKQSTPISVTGCPKTKTTKTKKTRKTRKTKKAGKARKADRARSERSSDGRTVNHGDGRNS